MFQNLLVFEGKRSTNDVMSARRFHAATRKAGYLNEASGLLPRCRCRLRHGQLMIN